MQTSATAQRRAHFFAELPLLGLCRGLGGPRGGLPTEDTGRKLRRLPLFCHVGANLDCFSRGHAARLAAPTRAA